MLKIMNFTKIYKGNKIAADNLNITVEAGDIYGFIGHNGAGKTTTMKAVVGALEFEKGEILINNVSIKDNPVLCKSMIAYIPDNPDIYEYLTGIQYLNFIGDIFKVKKEKKEKLIKKYASLFEISGNLGDLISSYSHGMKQKLVIISALIHEPKLLIMDEPFVGLDPKAAHIFKSIMHEMCDNGSAIFFSTHVLDVAEKLCNKVSIIRGGKLIASGSINEVIGNKSLEDVFMELIDHD